MDVGSKTTWDFKRADHDDADDDDDGDSASSSSIGSMSEDSINSVMTGSLSSSLSESTEETADSSTTSSSFSSSSSAQSNGPLYELSQLMNHLPIKRGLSMFYEGKAQSFSSLATVESIGDLPKKATPYNNCRKKMKSSKSYAGDLDRSLHTVKSHISPKATISKKSSRGPMVSALSSSSRRGSFLGGSRLSVAVHKNF